MSLLQNMKAVVFLAMLLGIGSGFVLGQHSPEGTREASSPHLALFDGIVANCSAWRSGDVLIKEVTTLDTTDLEPDGVISGRLLRSERLDRLAFDYESGRFAWFMMFLESDREFVPSSDGSLPEPPVLARFDGWTCSGPDGIVARLTKGGAPDRWRRSRFPDDNVEFLRMIGLPDVRFLCIHQTLDVHGRLDRDAGFAARRAGANLVSAIANNQTVCLKFQLQNISHSDSVAGVYREFTIDPERLVPESVNVVMERNDGRRSFLHRCAMEWEEAKGVQRLVAIHTRENKAVPAGEGEKIGEMTRDFELKWLRFNEAIDESVFEFERLLGDDAVLKMVDPRRNSVDFDTDR